jgi:vacuolar protein sorting-associated protein 13A/C
LSAPDVIVAKLGNIDVKNKYRLSTDKQASLNNFAIRIRSICLLSELLNRATNEVARSAILKDVDIAIDLDLASDQTESHIPSTQLKMSVSDIALALNFLQYILLLDVYHLVMSSPYTGGSGSQTSGNTGELKSEDAAKDDGPDGATRIKFDMLLKIPRAGLEVFTNGTDSLGRLSIVNVEYRQNTRANGTSWSELIVEDFSATDTRTSISTFHREVIPRIADDKKKLLIEYSSNVERFSTLLVTIDSPQVLFIPDFAFALQTFFVDGYSKSRLKKDATKTVSSLTAIPEDEAVEAVPEIPENRFSFRVNVVDAELIVLRDSAVEATDAILISIEQLVLAQESILSLAIGQMGMCLFNMTKRESTILHLVQAFDMTFILDSRSPSPDQKQLVLSLEVADSILLRVSYHDLMVLLDTLQRITELSSKSAPAPSQPALSRVHSAASQLNITPAKDQHVNTVETVRLATFL